MINRRTIKNGANPPFQQLRSKSSSFDFDTSRFGLFAFLNANLQDTVLAFSRDILRIGNIRKCQPAEEFTVGPFDPAIAALLVFIRGLVVAFTLDCKYTVFHRDLDVFRIDTWDIGNHNVTVSLFPDIYRRRPGTAQKVNLPEIKGRENNIKTMSYVDSVA